MLRRSVLACALLVASLPAGAAPPRVATADDLAKHLEPKPGRAMLVHLWASWCRPCIVEWPHLAEALRELEGRPIDIVVVSLDEPEAAPLAEKVLAKAGEFPGQNLLVPPEAAESVIRKLDPDWQGAVPTTLIADGEGRIVLAQRGATRFDEMATALDRVAPARPAGGKAAAPSGSR